MICFDNNQVYRKNTYNTDYSNSCIHADTSTVVFSNDKSQHPMTIDT